VKEMEVKAGEEKVQPSPTPAISEEERKRLKRELPEIRQREPWKYRRVPLEEYPDRDKALLALATAEPSQKVAYVITLLAEIEPPQVDLAAVLVQSIIDVSSERDCVFNQFDLVAIIGGTATMEGTGKSLKRLGFTVLQRDFPVKVEEIQGEYLRKTIASDGCCGEKELLKLHAFTLTDFYRVVAVDLDVIFLRNLDPLLAMDTEIVFTVDIGMAIAKAHLPPVQGGLFVIKPSQEAFDALVGIVRKGDYFEETGWGGLYIGWNYGGKTIQGLYQYYYGKIARPELSYEADRCVYNAMYDREDDCKDVRIGSGGPDGKGLRTMHFTVCQKPTSCNPKPWCADAHKRWNELRVEVEKSKEWEPIRPCDPHGHYQPMPYPKIKTPAPAKKD